MDIMHELFGTFSGWLVLVVGLVMVVGIPVGIAVGLRHAGPSPAETRDRMTHPVPDTGKRR